MIKSRIAATLPHRYHTPMPKDKNKSFSYADAGVSIEQGNELVNRIKSASANTTRRGVVGGLGGFGALFDISMLEYKQPVLVSGTDGVGTKIKLAIDFNRHQTIGIDLVAMCVNDLIVQGAEPLFFLDYFASSKLDVDIAEMVITGIAEGCKQAGCSLIGGETAEMPGMYAAGDYDLAGFCVGVVEKDAIIDGSKVAAGDSLIAIASSGCHSNGYSLIRKIIDETAQDLGAQLDGKTLLDILLEPTRIYVKTALALIQQIPVHAIAHITGGGLTENIPRVLPDGLGVDIDVDSWQRPAVFQWLQDSGNISDLEMLTTFNCGIGLIICVKESDKDKSLSLLDEIGETAWCVGQVVKTKAGTDSVNYL